MNIPFGQTLLKDLGKQTHIPVIFQAIINYAIMTTAREELKRKKTEKLQTFYT